MHNHVQKKKKKKKTNYRRAWLSAFQYIANCVRVTALSTTERRGCCQCALPSQSNAINSQLNKTKTCFLFQRALAVATDCFKRPGHVASEPLLEVSIRNPSFVPRPLSCPICFLLQRAPPLRAHDNLFIHHNKQDERPQYARRQGRLSALYMFDDVILPFLTTYVKTSAIQQKVRGRTPAYIPSFSPYRSSGRRTVRSLRTLGFNAYVTADLFMKCNKGSRAKIWHICAFLWEGTAAALWEDFLRRSWYTKKGEEKKGCSVSSERLIE